ncbi:hypothetical protein GV791_30010 [Nocardia cyriacigeorgica]|jgi:hypothetical protein|uniref:Uncharacterized protein n=2 Tax=Nocardia TaxID=1817 RepID=A0A366D119_9NOCA|nr:MULTISPECIES: hypothetical protein [Nocardia]AVH20778.1 hypothetical protein C5B73_04125 [Nocardia cyriacigeorgica]MBF6188631.1 hypothetical protein [Nocardia farcinica]MBF6326850.1 hypothetical protein [Nocardia cyriacigeorgica]MBF6387682.1 hypothetical protein [Nocardia farcinica]MBF6422113.1 hypothetical protein [Nocardia farcinica]
MYSTPTPTILGAALYRVYADSSHAPDSLELWIAIAETAVRELQMPVLAALVPWVPIALRYEQVTTDGEFFPHSGAVRVMTGPLTGTLYGDLETAAREVVVATLDQLPKQDCGDTSDSGSDSGNDGDEQTVTVYRALPSWRFRNDRGPAAPGLRAVPPLIS